MTGLELFQPAYAEQAIGLLRTSVPPIDSPTQRRIRSENHLERGFKHGLYRPEWVWAARRGDRAVGGIAASAPWGPGVPRVIGHISHPGATPEEHADFAALAARATDDLCPSGCTDVLIYAPPDVGFDAPALAPLIVALHDCGWAGIKAGRHYEFEVRFGLGDDIPSELRLERLVAADDERLLSVFPQVLAGSLDRDHVEDAIDSDLMRHGVRHSMICSPPIQSNAFIWRSTRGTGAWVWSLGEPFPMARHMCCSLALPRSSGAADMELSY
jgi:hypothetical protein